LTGSTNDRSGDGGDESFNTFLKCTHAELRKKKKCAGWSLKGRGKIRGGGEHVERRTSRTSADGTNVRGGIYGEGILRGRGLSTISKATTISGIFAQRGLTLEKNCALRKSARAVPLISLNTFLGNHSDALKRGVTKGCKTQVDGTQQKPNRSLTRKKKQ